MLVLRISIHALRKESDWTFQPFSVKGSIFQSTLSVRRATDSQTVTAAGSIFQSTLSVRRATSRLNLVRVVSPFQSTLSVRRATHEHAGRLDLEQISIHALRKESDRAAGHFCPLSETQASCLALSISNNTTGTTNNMPKTSSDNVRIPAHFRFCSSLRC